MYDAGAVLDEQPGGPLVAKRVDDDLGQLARGLVLAALQRCEIEVAQRRRPESRASPDRKLEPLVGLERARAQLLQRASVAARAGAGERVVEDRLAGGAWLAR